MPRQRRQPTTPAKYLRTKLDEIRSTRNEAENVASFSAAASLHRLEIDVMALMWERDAIEANEAADRAAKAEAQVDDAAVLSDVLAGILSLPPLQREQIVAALTRPPALRVVGE